MTPPTLPSRNILDELADPDRHISEEEQLAMEAAEDAMHAAGTLRDWRWNNGWDQCSGHYAEPWPGAWAWHTAREQRFSARASLDDSGQPGEPGGETLLERCMRDVGAS